MQCVIIASCVVCHTLYVGMVRKQIPVHVFNTVPVKSETRKRPAPFAVLRVGYIFGVLVDSKLEVNKIKAYSLKKYMYFVYAAIQIQAIRPFACTCSM